MIRVGIDMNSSEESRIEKLRRLLGTGGDAMFSMARLSTDSAIPMEQTQMAPDCLEWLEDVSHARWIEESLSDFGTLRSMLPRGFSSYARIFHAAYLGEEMQPVRWSTVASWTGRPVHPLMQFERIADLDEGTGVMYPDPPWGSHPDHGSAVELTLEQELSPRTCVNDNVDLVRLQADVPGCGPDTGANEDPMLPGRNPVSPQSRLPSATSDA